VTDGRGHQAEVGVVEAGQGVPEVYWYAVAKAGGEAEEAPLGAGTWQLAAGEGGDRGGPVDAGHGRGAVIDADGGVDEAVAEVGAVRPGRRYEQLAGGFSVIETGRAGAQRGGRLRFGPGCS
jgi:hypothetical protein